MDGLFQLIIKTSVYGSITGLLILIIKLILKEKLTPRWSHLLWILLVIKMIVPFGPESNFSIFNKIENREISDNSSYDNKLYNNLVTKDNTQISDIINPHYSKVESTSNINKNLLDYDIEPLDANLMAFNSEKFTKYIRILWILVTISILLFVVISYGVIYIKLNKYPNKSIQKLDNILEDAKELLYIRKDIKIIVNSYINTPAITGVFSPRILLPINMVNLKDSELKHIFLHELAHYKRKDNFLNGVLLIIQSIHWFNPLIWYFFKKLRENTELATDEKVLNILKDENYHDYGLTLLTVLSKINGNRFQPNLVGMATNKKDMERRIMNIKFMKKSKSKKILLTAVGMLVVGATSLTILTSAQSITQFSYADTKKSDTLKEHKLNEMQNTFFNLVKFMEDNKDISVDELRSNVKNLKLKETEQLGKDNRADIYIKGNGQIKVYYVKRDGQGPYLARNVEYILKNEDSQVKTIRLAHVNVSSDKKVISLQLSTESSKELNNSSKLLNLDILRSELYPTYVRLLKEIESKDCFTKKDLLKFNERFKEIGMPYDPSSDSFDIRDDYARLIINFNEKTEQVSTVELSDVSSNRGDKEYITTKTKSLEYDNWDVQEYYSEEYNLTYNKIGHLITIDNENVNDAKNTFIKFMRDDN